MFLERIPVRLRLSLGHAIWMALLFLGVGVGVYKLVERNLYQSVDAALITSANSIRSARSAVGYRSPFTQSFLREFFGEKYIRPYAQLVDLSGRVSARTENIRVSLPVTPLAAARAEQGLETIENIPRRGFPPLRQITLPVMRKDIFTGELIQVGAALDSTFHTLRSISLMLWIALPVGLLLTIVFGYILTAWSLRPVRAVTRAAGRLGSDELTMRLKLPHASDEISELTQTFNGMLDRLQDAFKRLQRFAGDVSHELRTPLTVLRGEAELALRRERSPEDYRKSLEVIAQEAIHMTDIVEDLLLLARAQSQSVAVHWELINIREFTDVLTTSVQPIFAKKRLTLKVESDYRQNTFMGSSGYLSLAIKNILLNAAKHSPMDAVVEFKVYEENDMMKFRIKDQGEGIAKDALPYIFDPFFRADTARNRAAGGSGIGLSLALALVKLHCGKLTVDSEVNHGATFEISIPRDPEQAKMAVASKVLGTKKEKAMLSLPSAPAIS